MEQTWHSIKGIVGKLNWQLPEPLEEKPCLGHCGKWKWPLLNSAAWCVLWGRKAEMGTQGRYQCWALSGCGVLLPVSWPHVGDLWPYWCCWITYNWSMLGIVGKQLLEGQRLPISALSSFVKSLKKKFRPPFAFACPSLFPSILPIKHISDPFIITLYFYAM